MFTFVIVMKERIKKILEVKSESPSDFALKIGVQRSSISHVLSGRNNPSLEFLQKILTAYPDISPDWLILDKGQMIRQPEGEKSSAGVKQMFKDKESIKLDISQLEIENDPVYERKSMPLKDTVTRPEQVIILYDDGTFRVYREKTGL